ncbi:ACT domain-containing protein [Archaeoglobus sulfaticallidus PM70-1]|uniref:ACT domain-containing protein n=1 Tax=Archaeoglobus sulfaticallidus PM70-1 TaxID=387631 RepID=N0BK92_9EURY|nr:ACT domain-containing protein [Archaeoglobus sulfaticallidus]AGK60560.1 ACT domain-containing protein [Archaeoglobus sulfaticallidus PM70-1]
MKEEKIIKQVSVFVENKPGRLSSVTEKLFNAGINIRAFTIAEAGDFGIIRMVVDDTDKAYDTLKKAGFTVSLTDVLGVEVKDEPGGLYNIAKALGDAGINIEYVYAFTSGGDRALIILRVDDINRAIEILEKEGALFKESVD